VLIVMGAGDDQLSSNSEAGKGWGGSCEPPPLLKIRRSVFDDRERYSSIVAPERSVTAGQLLD